jgi:hypothetical protein
LKISGTPEDPKLNVGLGGDTGASRYVCGWGNPSVRQDDISFNIVGEFKETSLNRISSESSDSKLDVESKPTHNLMPVMIYIGKKREEDR